MTIFFDPEEWAPGMWAGMEGHRFTLGGLPYQITYVSLEHKYVRIRAVE